MESEKCKSNPNKTLKLVIKSQENKRGRVKKKTYKCETINKMSIRIYILKITLNINMLEVPT